MLRRLVQLDVVQPFLLMSNKAITVFCAFVEGSSLYSGASELVSAVPASCTLFYAVSHVAVNLSDVGMSSEIGTLIADSLVSGVSCLSTLLLRCRRVFTA